MGFTLRLGLLLAIIGTGAFLVGGQSVQEQQTTAGQVERAVSDEAQTEYEQNTAMRNLGGLAAVIGGLLVVVGSMSSGGNNVSSGTSTAGNVRSTNRDIYTVQPGEFTYMKFDVGRESILDYTMEVLDGPSINVIVTDEQYLDDFKDTPTIGWVEEASAVNVSNIEKTAKIGPRDYAIILDNTGRYGGQNASGEARVDLNIELTS
jgi:hypothetical protein